MEFYVVINDTPEYKAIRFKEQDQSWSSKGRTWNDIISSMSQSPLFDQICHDVCFLCIIYVFPLSV